MTMPVEAKPQPIPVTLTQHESHVYVEWEWAGETYYREYHWSTDPKVHKGDFAGHRDAAITRANDLATHLRSLHMLDHGPCVFKLTPEDVADRQRRAELERELWTLYVAKFIDREDGAKELADELRIPRERVAEDDRLVQRYLNCKAKWDGRHEAQTVLDTWIASLTEDQRADLHVTPSLKQRHARLKGDVDTCRDARRGCREVQRLRPEFFDDAGRLLGELATV